jgi:hypothetical protein
MHLFTAVIVSPALEALEHGRPALEYGGCILSESLLKSQTRHVGELGQQAKSHTSPPGEEEGHAKLVSGKSAAIQERAVLGLGLHLILHSLGSHVFHQCSICFLILLRI